MEQYEAFRQLSTQPFSSTGLCLLEEAVRIIRRRYPDFAQFSLAQDPLQYPTLESFRDAKKPLPDPPASWIKTASDMIPTLGDDRISPSLWALVNGLDLDASMVNVYLDLVKSMHCSTQVVKIRPLQSGINQDDGRDQPVVIPFQDGNQWAFAVAYRDCVHWFDSGSSRKSPRLSDKDGRSLVTDWTGPKHVQPEDSGAFMLLGIRLILKGSPHASQEVANEMIPTFRARMMAEIRYGKLNPADVDSEPPAAPPSPSMDTRDCTPAVHGSPYSPITPPDSGETTSSVKSIQPRPRKIALSSRSKRPTVASTPLDRRETASSPAAIRRRQQSGTTALANTPIRSDSRRIILEHLNKAVVASRFTRASDTTDLTVLWSLVSQQEHSSIFHKRYNAALFFDRMNGLEDPGAIYGKTKLPMSRQEQAKVKAMHSQCKLWSQVCALREEWGIKKYVLLCAIPGNISTQSVETLQRQDKLLSDFQEQLDDASNPLNGQLWQAADLCEAVVRGELPSEPRMIDLYPWKQHEGLDHGMYEAFLSLSARPKAQLPLVGDGRT